MLLVLASISQQSRICSVSTIESYYLLLFTSLLPLKRKRRGYLVRFSLLYHVCSSLQFSPSLGNVLILLQQWSSMLSFRYRRFLMTYCAFRQFSLRLHYNCCGVNSQLNTKPVIWIMFLYDTTAGFKITESQLVLRHATLRKASDVNFSFQKRHRRQQSVFQLPTNHNMRDSDWKIVQISD